ncbi:MAG TPA: hypothetical protein PKD64_04795 [Pirellulaceae bacterium]|nr:hypothetical protein [Pirellulaceae bacterium]HMO91492.1 hypothetical protein [Pirellulaceae bacterium]HMP70953.1 hypothetical protein [Pirellulaceae bacterium]
MSLLKYVSILFVIGLAYFDLFTVRLVQLASPQETTNEKGSERTSPLDKFAAAASEHLGMIFDGRTLSLPFDQEVVTSGFADDMRSKLGLNSHSTTSGGAGNWYRNFNASGMEMEVGEGFRRVQHMMMQGAGRFLKFHDLNETLGSITYNALNDQEFTLVRNGGLGGDFFFLVQKKNGEAFLLSIPKFDMSSDASASSQVIALSYPNFREMWDRHGLIVDQQLLPSLRSTGFAGPIGRTSELVTHTLLSRFDEETEEWKQFVEIASKLDANEFETREAAAKQLNDGYQNWHAQIAIGIDSEQLGISARAELRKILNKKGSREIQQLSNILQSLELFDRPEVLVTLLDQGSPHANERILQRISELSGEQFQDVDGCRQFFAKREHEANKSLVKLDSLSSGDTTESLFDQCLTEFAELAQFTVDESGNLVLDREAWATIFGGKTVKELAEEMVAELNQRNLPTSWLNSEKTKVRENYGFDHVFFEKITDRLTQSSSGSSGNQTMVVYGQSQQVPLNREISTEDFSCEIRINGAPLNQAGGDGAKRQFLAFSYREKGDFGTRLSLSENDRGVRFTLFMPSSKEFIDFLQIKDEGCRLALINESGVTIAHDKDFASLYSSHQDVFQTQILPNLGRYGFNLSEKFGGPHVFERRPLRTPENNKEN